MGHLPHCIYTACPLEDRKPVYIRQSVVYVCPILYVLEHIRSLSSWLHTQASSVLCPRTNNNITTKSKKQGCDWWDRLNITRIKCFVKIKRCIAKFLKPFFGLKHQLSVSWSAHGIVVQDAQRNKMLSHDDYPRTRSRPTKFDPYVQTFCVCKA